MLKLLIVEDERWEREGLVDFIDWGSYRISVAGTACNGIEGFEQAVRIHPDIIITDIKMPGMDGILMSKKIKERLPETKIIILTGYDDFAYAKDAINCNANGYILKNCEEEEMIEVIEKVVEECLKERERAEFENNVNELINQKTSIARQAFFTNLLQGKYTEYEIRKNFQDFGIQDKLNGYYMVAVIKLKDFESGRYIQEVSHNAELSPEALDVLEEIEKSAEKGRIFSICNFMLKELVFGFCNMSTHELEAEMKNLADKVTGKYGTEILAGIGETVNSVTDIRQSYLCAKDTVEACAFWGYSGVENSANLEDIHNSFYNDASEFLIRSTFYSKQIMHSIRAKDEERALTMLQELFENINCYKLRGVSREMVTNILQSILNDVFILIHNLNAAGGQPLPDKYDIFAKNGYLPDIRVIKEEISRYIKTAINSIGAKKLSKDEQIIKNVINIISSRYAADINLRVIASEVYLSPNYLGQMFKKYTGKSINDYICEYRMEKAKALLRLPGEKIVTVANKVGIPNPSYFCTVFKNIYGIAPGEYQKLVMENPHINI